ncbi:DUF397 domain-containing protein [Streptomyces sp. NPDC004646]
MTGRHSQRTGHVDLTWRKSTYSDGTGGDCLEVTDAHPTHIPVRDSKNPHGPNLLLPPEAWSAFVENLKPR